MDKVKRKKLEKAISKLKEELLLCSVNENANSMFADLAELRFFIREKKVKEAKKLHSKLYKDFEGILGLIKEIEEGE